ncbi:hypothetical protein DPMN_166634 [Dreissena polymorpha]|uniref:Uncharacterized protein n=1 Tax=Dreissena polymorpha TaxID=45954 RepID=A0A9D4F2G7_DREPO|nr:hypothetical protein DPMN_166634 [Dreissena polymorpha]
MAAECAHSVFGKDDGRAFEGLTKHVTSRFLIPLDPVSNLSLILLNKFGLNKFHKDWTNVASRDFELDRDIIGTNVINKFHEDQTIKVASKVFEICQYIIGTYVLSKFHKDWAIIGTSKVKTVTHPGSKQTGTIFQLGKMPHLPGHVFQRTKIIFQLCWDIIGKNVPSKFH